MANNMNPKQPFDNFRSAFPNRNYPISYRPECNYQNSIISESAIRIPSPDSPSFRFPPVEPIYEHSFYASEPSYSPTNSAELGMKLDNRGTQESAHKAESPLERAVREIRTNLAGIGEQDASPKSPTKAFKSLIGDERSSASKDKSIGRSPRTPTTLKSLGGRQRSTSGKAKRRYSDFIQARMSPVEKYERMTATIRDLDKDLDIRLADLKAGRKTLELEINNLSAPTSPPRRQNCTITTAELIATMSPKTRQVISFDFSDEMRSSDIYKTPVPSPKSEIANQTLAGKLVYQIEHDEEGGGVPLDKEINTHYEEMNEIREREKGGMVAGGKEKNKGTQH
jgi:hypothetical protein